MFERFTVTGRQVLANAQVEALSRGHNFIGTEHLLLGVLRGGPTASLGAELLDECGIGYDRIAGRVVEIVGSGAPQAAAKAPPFTPRAKTVMETSLRQALRLGHSYVAAEHLVLGLVVEGEGVAARILVIEEGLQLADLVSKVGERSVRPDNVRPPRRFPRRTGRVVEERVETLATPLADATPMAGAAIAGAQAAADAAEAPVDSSHLLITLAEQEGSVAAAALESLGITPEKLREAIASIDLAATAEAPEEFGPLIVRTEGGTSITFGDLDTVEAILVGLRSIVGTSSEVLPADQLVPGTSELTIPQLDGPLRAAVLLWLEDLSALG